MKLVRVPHVPHPSDERGWHTEAVEAWEDNDRIGIIKVSWIPADEMETRYPTVDEYTRAIRGYGQTTPDMLEDLLPAYTHFQEFHGHPFVAGVRVEEAHRRRGVATALYREAALWLTERGLSLGASDTQTPEAEALWGHLRGRHDFVPARLPDGRWALRPAPG